MAKLNIGLIGAGRMGRVFARHIALSTTRVNFAAVADTFPGVAVDVAAEFGAAQSYTNPLDLLEQKDIQAVVIVTPTGTHVDVVKAAAAAGKQIFCEKPLSLTVAGCDEALAAVSQAGVTLQVGFMRRFDPAYRAAKKRILNGDIGDPVMIKSLGRDPHRTSLEFARRDNSGGILLDMGIHDFDSSRWLMGSEVERVYSEGGCLVFPELNEVGDLDNACVNMKFANGAIGNIDVSRNAVYGYDIRTEVLGSKGAIQIGRLQYTPMLVLTPNAVTHDTLPYFTERYGDAYAAELQHFITCVLEDKQPEVSGADARMATAIGVAATLSYDEQRPVLLKEVV
jgi:scyllo-inositol 2-dehydrogenase (NAD+)